jgi:pimeloyl-ACP methyl ester carboxylesterase
LYDPDGLVPLSSRRNRFVRFDGRGFGLSDRGVKDYSLDAKVSDLAAVIDQLGVAQVGLHAYSSGGPTAIAYAARYPQRVSRLVLGATFATGEWVSEEQREFDLRLAPLIESNWDDRSVRNLVVARLNPENDPVSQNILNEFLYRACDGPGVAGFFRELYEHDVEDLARQIRAPTLVIHGRSDGVIPVEAGRNLASLIPGARFELIEGGHREGIGGTAATRTRVIEFLNEGSGL